MEMEVFTISLPSIKEAEKILQARKAEEEEKRRAKCDRYRQEAIKWIKETAIPLIELHVRKAGISNSPTCVVTKYIKDVCTMEEEVIKNTIDSFIESFNENQKTAGNGYELSVANNTRYRHDLSEEVIGYNIRISKARY